MNKLCRLSEKFFKTQKVTNYLGGKTKLTVPRVIKILAFYNNYSVVFIVMFKYEEFTKNNSSLSPVELR